MIVFLLILTKVLFIIIVAREFSHMDILHKERLSHAETKGRLRYYLEQNANKTIK